MDTASYSGKYDVKNPNIWSIKMNTMDFLLAI